MMSEFLCCACLRTELRATPPPSASKTTRRSFLRDNQRKISHLSENRSKDGAFVAPTRFASVGHCRTLADRRATPSICQMAYSDWVVNPGRIGHMPVQKITFGEMRKSGASGVIVFCSDSRCAHSVKLSADCWPDKLRLSDIEGLFVCKVCGNRGATVRPDFNDLRTKAVPEQPRTI
jgi:hypothetical protein